MKHIILTGLIAIAVIATQTRTSEACTGITLKAKDGSYIVARTIEWGGSYLNSQYVIVPRGHQQQSLVPGGTDGMRFTARYGYVGLSVELEQFVVEGINEAGLSAGLFYFPGRHYSKKLHNIRLSVGLLDFGQLQKRGRGERNGPPSVRCFHRPPLLHGPLALRRCGRPSNSAGNH